MINNYKLNNNKLKFNTKSRQVGTPNMYIFLFFKNFVLKESDNKTMINYKIIFYFL